MLVLNSGYVACKPLKNHIQCRFCNCSSNSYQSSTSSNSEQWYCPFKSYKVWSRTNSSEFFVVFCFWTHCHCFFFLLLQNRGWFTKGICYVICLSVLCAHFLNKKLFLDSCVWFVFVDLMISHLTSFVLLCSWYNQNSIHTLFQIVVLPWK